jgi:hypothetical protein
LHPVRDCIGFYQALGLGIIAVAAAHHPTGFLPRLQIAASLTLIVSLAIASWLRAADWARSRDIQMDVVRQFPRVASVGEAFDGAGLYTGPLGPGEVPIASALWEISGVVGYALGLQSHAMGAQAMRAVWRGGAATGSSTYRTGQDRRVQLARQCDAHLESRRGEARAGRQRLPRRV